MWLVWPSMRPGFIQLQMFSIWFTSEDCGGHSILRLSLFSNHDNTTMLKHKWVLLVPKHLLYWLQQIFIYEVNVRMMVEIFIKDYQIANAMAADVSSNPKRNVST